MGSLAAQAALTQHAVADYINDKVEGVRGRTVALDEVGDV
jgi:hypothetical protein